MFAIVFITKTRTKTRAFSSLSISSKPPTSSTHVHFYFACVATKSYVIVKRRDLLESRDKAFDRKSELGIAYQTHAWHSSLANVFLFEVLSSLTTMQQRRRRRRRRLLQQRSSDSWMLYSYEPILSLYAPIARVQFHTGCSWLSILMRHRRQSFSSGVDANVFNLNINISPTAVAMCGILARTLTFNRTKMSQFFFWTEFFVWRGLFCNVNWNTIVWLTFHWLLSDLWI